MSWFSKVAWKEGLFLQPQHLQQAQSEEQADMINTTPRCFHARALAPWPSGSLMSIPTGQLSLAEKASATCVCSQTAQMVNLGAAKTKKAPEHFLV